MKKYSKDGKTKSANKIILVKGGMQVINPTHEQLVADGWTEYTVSEPVGEELLARRKELKLSQIELYDKSKEVDDCIIRKDGVEFSYWKDKHERDSLKNAVKDHISLGRETYRLDLREYGVSIHIPCEALVTMLSTLEVYATDCYNRTTDHIYAVNALTTIEEVVSYDYRTGYPEKLVFEL